MEKNIISINKKVAEKTKIAEVTGDIIVPDIKPDIVNIINTNGNAYIYKEELSQGKIRIDGNVDTYVVYLSDNGETRSIQTTVSFVESLDDLRIVEGMITKEKVTIENIETKILNERKITIKINIKIKTEFFEKSEIEILNELEEMKDIEKLKENMNIKSIIGMNKVKTSIKEDIAVENSFDIAEILKTDISISNFENKISYNKVLAKADANVKVIFITEDNRISSVETTIPIMSFIDIEKVNENNICNVDYTIRNMLFKANSKEMHSIACQVDFEVYCEAYETKNIEIIQDMYGIKQDVIFSKKEADVQITEELKNEKVSLNERIIVEDIHAILDADCQASIISSNKSVNSTNYEGEVNLVIYYESDNRNGLNVKSVKIPFITKLDNYDDEINVKVIQKKFTISNENVDCEIELALERVNTSFKKINIIENIERKECEEENDYRMYIYFAKAGDTIWKVAKKFKVGMDDIIHVNNLENQNKINIGDKLYIMK